MYDTRLVRCLATMIDFSNDNWYIIQYSCNSKQFNTIQGKQKQYFFCKMKLWKSKLIKKSILVMTFLHIVEQWKCVWENSGTAWLWRKKTRKCYEDKDSTVSAPSSYRADTCGTRCIMVACNGLKTGNQSQVAPFPSLPCLLAPHCCTAPRKFKTKFYLSTDQRRARLHLC